MKLWAWKNGAMIRISRFKRQALIGGRCSWWTSTTEARLLGIPVPRRKTALICYQVKEIK